MSQTIRKAGPFTVETIRTINATRWELLCARLLGKKVIGYDGRFRIHMRNWKGRMYLISYREDRSNKYNGTGGNGYQPLPTPTGWRVMPSKYGVMITDPAGRSCEVPPPGDYLGTTDPVLYAFLHRIACGVTPILESEQ